MRILSNFHDYYDGVMAMDGDRSIIYHRIPAETTSKDKNFARLIPPLIPSHYRKEGLNNSYYGHYRGLPYSQFIIGFCGKIYRAVISTTNDFFYSAEDFIKWVINQNSYEEYSKWYYKDQYKREDRSLDLYFSYNNNDGTFLDNVFTTIDSPIFIMWYNYHDRTENFLVNGCLNKYNFQKIIPPYQAYQELSMYVGGMAQQSKPMPKISDEVMQSIKGFEHKYSFRKEPE